MIATLLSLLAGYLLSIVFMTALSYLAYKAVCADFPSLPKDPAHFVLCISIFIPLALKNFPSLALISEFPFIFPSSIFEMIATIVGVTGYLVCITGLSFAVIIIVILVCQAASQPVPEKETEPDWMLVIGLGASIAVMDVFVNHAIHSTMISILFPLSAYVVYIVCMTGLPCLVCRGAISTFSVPGDKKLLVAFISILLPLTLKNFSWLPLISEFTISLPSSVSEMIATLVGLTGYLVCMTGLSFLVFILACLVCELATSHSYPEEKCPYWIDMIVLGVTSMVMDMFVVMHSSDSRMMDMLLFAGYLVYIFCTMVVSALVFQNLVFDDNILPVLPFLRPVALKYRQLASVIVAWVILVLNDMHGLSPVEKPAFISESLSTLPSIVSGTLPGYIIYIACMVALSFWGLIIAVGAICRIRIWCPMLRTELILTTIIGITSMLLNMMWGTPFERPSNDSDMKAALVGLAGYLIYILCSTALSRLLSKSMTDAFVISLTFVLLDMFGVSDIISTLVGLVWMIGTSVMSFFFLVVLSFAVSMGLRTWVAILLPSAVNNYRELMFASIVGFSFKVMKIMLDIPAVEKLSILSNMKAALLGIADLRKDYHVAYLVITYLTVLSLPCLFMESRYTTSMFKLHTTTAIIIALGLVLTMPPSPPMPIKDLALQAMVLDEIIQRTVTSFVTHTILILVTLIVGMVFYARDQYPQWKSTITAGCRELWEDNAPEAKIYIEDLVYNCTRGWCGKKKVIKASRRRADHRR